MAEPVQTYKNHAKFVPLFHFVTVPILAANMVWAIRAAINAPNTSTVLAAATAIAIVFVAFFARLFALTAQDRVIRLEERMRMQELLPAAFKPRIGEFTTKQLVALRFASDAELPDLAQAVLRDGMTDQKQIKLLIKNWRADHQRV